MPERTQAPSDDTAPTDEARDKASVKTFSQRGRRGYTAGEAEVVAARRALFGSLIRALREKAGHSLSKVAAKIGASTANTARSYESGCYPAGSTIRRYGPVLGVKSRDLALARLYCQDVELYHLLYGTAPPVALRRHLQALPSERLTALLRPLPAPEAALLRASIRPKEGPLL